MSWKWYECYADIEGISQYYLCQTCKNVPAMALTYWDDHEYGPWCKRCWINQVNKEFLELDKVLENETWGDFPTKCSLCPIYTHDIRMLIDEQKKCWVCDNCYNKYSEK